MPPTSTSSVAEIAGWTSVARARARELNMQFERDMEDSFLLGM